MKKQKRNQKMIPTVMFHSDWFECRKCGNRELRRVQGDISSSPCSECGNSPMYRMK
jgi:ribosomal protein L37AE/L43A